MTVFLENDEVSQIIQSTSWADDGNKIAFSCKDKKLYIFDARTNKIEKQTISHKNMRDSRVLYINDYYVLTTGRIFCLIKIPEK